MAAAIETAKAEGVTHIVFGDLFLEDVRAYREEKLAGSGITRSFRFGAVRQKARARNHRGRLKGASCLYRSRNSVEIFRGAFDSTLLEDLPEDVDPCGERGEFHTCVVAGPMFSREIEVKSGEVVERDGFVFADSIPA